MESDLYRKAWVTPRSQICLSTEKGCVPVSQQVTRHHLSPRAIATLSQVFLRKERQVEKVFRKPGRADRMSAVRRVDQTFPGVGEGGREVICGDTANFHGRC